MVWCDADRLIRRRAWHDLAATAAVDVVSLWNRIFWVFIRSFVSMLSLGMAISQRLHSQLEDPDGAPLHWSSHNEILATPISVPLGSVASCHIYANGRTSDDSSQVHYSSCQVW